jgi:hypothetical protein
LKLSKQLEILKAQIVEEKTRRAAQAAKKQEKIQAAMRAADSIPKNDNVVGKVLDKKLQNFENFLRDLQSKCSLCKPPRRHLKMRSPTKGTATGYLLMAKKSLLCSRS